MKATKEGHFDLAAKYCSIYLSRFPRLTRWGATEHRPTLDPPPRTFTTSQTLAIDPPYDNSFFRKPTGSVPLTNRCCMG